MNAAQWNELFFEERMSYIGHLPKPAPHVGEIWRTIEGTNGATQVSLCGKKRRTCMADIVTGRVGTVKHNFKAATPEEVDAAFPLQKEVLFDA